MDKKPIKIQWVAPNGKHYEDREIAPYSMVIAIAPRSRLPEEKCDQFPKLADLEVKAKSQSNGSVKIE